MVFKKLTLCYQVMPEVATTACSKELLALVQQTVEVLRLQRLLKLHLMP